MFAKTRGGISQHDLTRLGDVVVSRDDIAVAGPDDPLLALLERLTPQTGERALVFDHGALVGIVTPTDVARAAQLADLRSQSQLKAP